MLNNAQTAKKPKKATAQSMINDRHQFMRIARGSLNRLTYNSKPLYRNMTAPFNADAMRNSTKLSVTFASPINRMALPEKIVPHKNK